MGSERGGGARGTSARRKDLGGWCKVVLGGLLLRGGLLRGAHGDD